MEVKKFLFLSRTQLWLVSSVLVLIIVVAACSVAYCVHRSDLQKIVDLGGETLKLALTASAAWALVILYASSNSPRRIESETRAFLRVDLVRPSRSSQESTSVSGAVVDDEVRIDMLPVACTNNSVTYKVSDASGQSMYLWCSLNVSDLAVVFMLPSRHADRYEQIYSATLAGFKRRAVEIVSFGLVPHQYDAERMHDYLELYSAQSLAEDFLFNASARYRTAHSLFGDLRSFLVCMRRAGAST